MVNYVVQKKPFFALLILLYRAIMEKVNDLKV